MYFMRDDSENLKNETHYFSSIFLFLLDTAILLFLDTDAFIFYLELKLLSKSWVKGTYSASKFKPWKPLSSQFIISFPPSMSWLVLQYKLAVTW